MSYQLYVLGGYGFTESLLPSLLHPDIAAEIAREYLAKGFQGRHLEPPVDWSGPPLTDLSDRQKHQMVDDLADGRLLLSDPFGASWGLFAQHELASDALRDNLPTRLRHHLQVSWPGKSRGRGFGHVGNGSDSLDSTIEPPFDPEPPVSEKGLYQLRLRYTWPDGNGVAGAPYSVAGLGGGRSGTLGGSGEALETGLHDWDVEVRLMGSGIDTGVRTYLGRTEFNLGECIAALCQCEAESLPVKEETTVSSAGRWPDTLGLVTFRSDTAPNDAKAFTDALQGTWADTLDASEETWRTRVRAVFDSGLHESTVRALGLNPQVVPRDIFPKAYEIACYLMTDEASLAALKGFADDYQDQHQRPQLSSLDGIAVFDVVLACLLSEACWRAYPDRMRVRRRSRPGIVMKGAGEELAALGNYLRQRHLRRLHRSVDIRENGTILEEIVRRPEGIELSLPALEVPDETGSSSQATSLAGAAAVARVTAPAPAAPTGTAAPHTTRIALGTAANDAVYAGQRSWLARTLPFAGTAFTFITGMLYSPSLGGELETVTAPDGTVYRKHSSETIYTATGPNGEQWQTDNPQDDVGYRTWLANGGDGSFEAWVAEGKPTETGELGEAVSSHDSPVPTNNELQLSTYKERINQTPIDGIWTGQRGESVFFSNKPEVTDYYDKGIKYSNGYPDFSPLTIHEVKVEKVTSDRKANFKAADQMLARKLGVDRKDITKMRKQENLTWHEVEDMRTMQLMPSPPHSKLGHIGGVGEAKKLESLQGSR